MSDTATLPNQTITDSRFFDALKRYWGYDAFRPRQEEIVRALASGRDVCVVMPTGGGKSLCYQLPAVLQEGRTAVVISPLIALMQDQVAQLRQMGIPAVFLNSAVVESDRRELKQKAIAGEYRLMYVSPERALMDGTADWLKQVPLSFFAIDEAHCISQWGHDFRPEYRQLGKLRALFPDHPIAAFTASATQQVRHDIVDQLHLRDPLKSVSSFRRENLRYMVKLCEGRGMQDNLLLQALDRVQEGNVIVYSPTIARVGEIMELLEEHDIPAVDYHGKMSSSARLESQERWMNEDVQVLVGTIAFGLGINKPNVRAVIRLALPDSIEQFYQETGRAGRDGMPADCYLFWEWKDKRLREYFMNQIGDSKEFAAAQHRFAQIEGFAKSSTCRQKQICSHFGELAPWTRCLNCDNCGTQFLKHQASVAPVAAPRPAPPSRVKKAPIPSQPLDGKERELWDYLREWRVNTAREKKLPAFVVLHDTVLDELSRRKPKTLSALSQIPGIGEKKLEYYGDSILQAVRKFEEGERASIPGRPRHAEALAAIKEALLNGQSFSEIAGNQNSGLNWVMSLAARLVEQGEITFDERWVEKEVRSRIELEATRLGISKLKPIREVLPEDISYGEIHLVVAHARRQKQSPKSAAGGSAI